MPQKPKAEKDKQKPDEESTAATEPQEPQVQSSPAAQELNREQLENLRRKLQRKFH